MLENINASTLQNIYVSTIENIYPSLENIDASSENIYMIYASS